MAIAENILKFMRQRLDSMPEAVSAQTIQIEVGEFRNVDPESLTFAFDSLKAHFPGCEQCSLKLTLCLAEALCAGEKHSYRPSFNKGFRCTECGAGIGKLLSGEQLQITGLNVETGEEKIKCMK